MYNICLNGAVGNIKVSLSENKYSFKGEYLLQFNSNDMIFSPENHSILSESEDVLDRFDTNQDIIVEKNNESKKLISKDLFM